MTDLPTADQIENELPESLPEPLSAPLPAPRASWVQLEPRSLQEMVEFAERLSVSTLVPTVFFKKPGDILVTMQWGYEIGLRPIQSLNSIAVINGRPSIFGDAAIALVWASKLCLSYDDWVENEDDTPHMIGVAKSHRKGTPGPIERRFSMADATNALLLRKMGPWQQYPKRMLVMRARGFLLRDLYADVLRGLITTEELQDY